MSFGSGVLQSRRGFSPAGAAAFRGGAISHHFIGPIIAAGDFFGLVLLGAVTGFGYDWLIKGAQFGKPIYIGLAGLAATLAVTLLYARGFYARSFVLSGDTIVAVCQVWLTVFAILAITGFLLGISDEFSRGALLTYFIAGAGLLIVHRMAASSVLRRAIRSGSLRGRRVALIGDRAEISPDHLRKSLRQHGYSVTSCFLFDPEKEVGELASEIPWGELMDLGRSQRIDEVMLAVRWSDGERLQYILNALKALPISVRLLPDETAASLMQKPIFDIGMTRTVELQREPLTCSQRSLKRAFDIVVALGSMVLFTPLVLAVAALIKIDSPGPVFFGQTRVGFNGAPFRIWKFRTMTTQDDGADIRQATRNDDRVTRVGRWLRTTSVDELPQLLNVLFGDMSLVGPRPHALAHDTQYDSVIATYALRRHVKPGITGWAQVSGSRGETPTVDLMLRRVELDLWYINNWSFWLDSRIVVRTAVALMRPRDIY